MNRKALLMIFLVVFIDLLGFGIIIPILPYYAKELGASALDLGWLMTSYSLAQFILAPVWGRVSDRIGRKPVLLISILGSAIGFYWMGTAKTLTSLFCGRIFAGICGANISTAYAYIADITTEENRTKGMGILGAGFGLGFLFGPAIGGILSQYGIHVPLLAGAALAGANWIFAAFVLREPDTDRAMRSKNRERRFEWNAWKTALRSPLSRLSIGSFFLLTLAVTQMEVTFALFVGSRFGLAAREAGYLLAALGLVMAIMQGGLVGRLAKRFGETALIRFGAWTSAAALAGFALSENLTTTTAALVCLAIGNGAMHPSLSALTSRGSRKDSHGGTMGVFHSASSLSRVLGPPIAGFLYDRVSMTAPYWAGVGLLMLIFMLSMTQVAMPKTATTRV